MLPTTGPGLEPWVEQFAESEGSVVEREPSGGTVVAVEVPLAVTHPHPMGHQAGEPSTEESSQLNHLPVEGQISVDFVAVIAINQMADDQLKLMARLRVCLGTHTPGK